MADYPRRLICDANDPTRTSGTRSVVVAFPQQVLEIDCPYFSTEADSRFACTIAMD
jgi:hypothetical protein